MSKKILLTSFTTWLSHHKSNSSDDLLIEIAKYNDIDDNFNPKSKIQNPKLQDDLLIEIAKYNDIDDNFNPKSKIQNPKLQDDLLIEIAKYNDIDGNFNPKSKIQNPKSPVSLIFLRQLPVDVQLASDRVIAKIAEINPDAIICCGMAESRPNLTVESTATCGDIELKTLIDLEKLLLGLSLTEISHDAGKFVCEGLYYSVLQYLSDRHFQIPCIFVHIPILNSNNLTNIIADFNLIIQKVALLEKIATS